MPDEKKQPDPNHRDPNQPTTNQEEWGERIDTSRDIARGGKQSGHVPGATGDEPDDPRSGQRGAPDR